MADETLAPEPETRQIHKIEHLKSLFNEAIISQNLRAAKQCLYSANVHYAFLLSSLSTCKQLITNIHASKIFQRKLQSNCALG